MRSCLPCQAEVFGYKRKQPSVKWVSLHDLDTHWIPSATTSTTVPSQDVYTPLSLSLTNSMYPHIFLSLSLPHTHYLHASAMTNVAPFWNFIQKLLKSSFSWAGLSPLYIKVLVTLPGQERAVQALVQAGAECDEGPGSQLVGCTRANTQRETGGCDVMARAGWSVTR